MEHQIDPNWVDKTYEEALGAALVTSITNGAKILSLYYTELVQRGVPQDLARELTISLSASVNAALSK